LAEERLSAICRELAEASPGVKVAIRHRLGEVPAGEPSVVIAVASAHREAAYEASRQALERLKKEAPIWKLEHFADGTADWREVERTLTPYPLTRGRERGIILEGLRPSTPFGSWRGEAPPLIGSPPFPSSERGAGG
jgi:hypothetical protein